MQHLDRTNRNVLRGLQFVARSLEVWFMYVAVSFVYRIVLYLSAKDRRIPISLLLAYTEFMDLLFLKDLAMKARELAKKQRHAAMSTKAVYLVMFIFMLLVTALSILANLMGIATTTLAIPSLQFIDINRNDSLAFRKLLASTPPGWSMHWDVLTVSRLLKTTAAQPEYTSPAWIRWSSQLSLRSGRECATRTHLIYPLFPKRGY
jgi:hypothetical protein